jgi:hypothetical protein
MTVVHSTFDLDDISKIASIEFWNSVLEPISLEFWNRNKDCIIQIIIDDVDFTLIVVWDGKDRWSLQIDKWSKTQINMNYSFYPVVGLLDQEKFVTLDSGMMVPSFSFVESKNLGRIIVDFVQNADRFPGGVQWINSAELNWPEDF